MNTSQLTIIDREKEKSILPLANQMESLLNLPLIQQIVQQGGGTLEEELRQQPKMMLAMLVGGTIEQLRPHAQEAGKAFTAYISILNDPELKPLLHKRSLKYAIIRHLCNIYLKRPSELHAETSRIVNNARDVDPQIADDIQKIMEGLLQQKIIAPQERAIDRFIRWLPGKAPEQVTK
jgi:hypothetical protein